MNVLWKSNAILATTFLVTFICCLSAALLLSPYCFAIMFTSFNNSCLAMHTHVAWVAWMCKLDVWNYGPINCAHWDRLRSPTWVGKCFQLSWEWWRLASEKTIFYVLDWGKLRKQFSNASANPEVEQKWLHFGHAKGKCEQNSYNFFMIFTDFASSLPHIGPTSWNIIWWWPPSALC